MYSCGGTLALLHEQNHEVYVVTVMGGGLPAVVPQSPIVKSLHALWAAGDNPLATRQQEDVEAVTSLSAQLIQLPVLDCIYRVIDYIQGAGGYLMTHEVWMYVLDAGLMAILMFMYNFIHPSEISAWLVGGKVAFLFKFVRVDKSEACGMVVSLNGTHQA